jgi:hypothetical protein
MNWTDLLTGEFTAVYSTAEALLDKVDAARLDWKPPAGSNWMTVAQLLRHLGEACGAGCRAFLTGDWGLPPGVKMEDIPPEEMLPPAEKLPAVTTLDEARRLLAADKALAFEALAQAAKENLGTQVLDAPWAPGKPHPLGWHFLQMAAHLGHHKSQLFYYLKLQGVPVNTADLWGQP